ncbi:MAG: VWA domain-containing protein, partial [Trueperaceae bacterium]|nr:VWA domain-containing protein [Trueperaceae bacterium]
MSVSFAAPAFLALLATLPLVVWWHVTRLRHRPRPVAALFLWEQALRDAARRRRWRPTWSLLLQLLAVAAAAFALTQPSVNWQGPPDLVIALDAGARMRAVDPEGERAARAREVVLDLAERAGAVALVRVGAVPELALAFTRDRGALRAALDAFETGDADVDVERGLDLARSVADGRSIAWVSDDPGPPLPGITRVGVAGSGRNVGIVAFDLGIQQAFVAVVSDHPRPVSVGVVLERLDGSLVASTELLVPAGGRASATFPVDVVGEIVRARLDLGPLADALALDDVAYAGRRALRVVMDEDEPALRRALGAVPGVEVQVTGAARFVAADLRVLTGVAPDGLRPGDHLLLPAPVA